MKITLENGKMIIDGEMNTIITLQDGKTYTKEELINVEGIDSDHVDIKHVVFKFTPNGLPDNLLKSRSVVAETLCSDRSIGG